MKQKNRNIAERDGRNKQGVVQVPQLVDEANLDKQRMDNILNQSMIFWWPRRQAESCPPFLASEDYFVELQGSVQLRNFLGSKRNSEEISTSVLISYGDKRK